VWSRLRSWGYWSGSSPPESSLSVKREYPVGVVSRQHVGVLVIRVWTEADGGMKARLTQTVDVEASDPDVTAEVAIATEGEILEAVRSWLEAFSSSNI
jgi:hypothetical protein